MVPVRVDPLLWPMGTAGGHRLVLLSLEVYADWADLRFARSETPGAAPLPRRVPHAQAWTISIDGIPATIEDAVGRGGRAFSNGEVRLRPPPPPGARLQVAVHLAPGEPALAATIALPTSAPSGNGPEEQP